MKIIIENKTFYIDEANTFLKRFIGLMFKKNISTGLLFSNCNSVHTFFMKESIDIVMIDYNNKVLLVKKAVPKNRIIYKKEAYHTIELPSNSINNLKIGETLIIKD